MYHRLILTARLWHVGVAARRRQQRLQVVLEGDCSLWSMIILTMTPHNCRASQEVNRNLCITLSSIAPDYGHICDSKVKQHVPHPGIAAAHLGACYVQRCAIDVAKRPDISCCLISVVHSGCLTLADESSSPST